MNESNSEDYFHIVYSPTMLIGPLTLWVALFAGSPDIADGIIYYLTNGSLF